MDLVYKHEKPLFRISATISILLWILLIVGTLGTALIFMLLRRYPMLSSSLI